MTGRAGTVPVPFKGTGRRADDHDMTATFREERNRVVPLEVVTAARTGDQEALGQIGAAVFRRLVSFYRYSSLPVHEAEDLAAESVAVVVGNLGALKSDEAFDAWMWSIGRNQLRGWLRKKKRGASAEPAPAAMGGPEDEAVLREEHAEVMVALASLSQRDRELLWLREVEGLSYEEIGGRLGAATGTVRVACHRARKRLEKAFRGEREGDNP